MNYKKWEGSDIAINATKADAVFGLISDLLESSVQTESFDVPESVRERYVPFDYAAIEKRFLVTMD